MNLHYATGLWPANVVPVKLACSQNHIFKGVIMPRHAQTGHRAWLNLMTSNFPNPSLSKWATQPRQWAKLTFQQVTNKDGILVKIRWFQDLFNLLAKFVLKKSCFYSELKTRDLSLELGDKINRSFSSETLFQFVRLQYMRNSLQLNYLINYIMEFY